MRRAGPVALLASALVLGAVASSADAIETEEVSIRADGAFLHAVLTIPGTVGPVPVALILPGSGPTDRDGNQPGFRNDVYRLIAEGLAANGVASLRIDKRGIGASAGAVRSELELTVEIYRRDAVAWADRLLSDERFSDLFLVGHSEGALYAILAAETVPAAGLVLIAGLGRPAAATIRWQLDRSGLPASLREAAEAVLSELEAGRRVAEPPHALDALFRASVQPYLISWFALDPAERLADLSIPALVMHGAADFQVPVEEARFLAAARDDVDLVVLDDVNHVLRSAPADREASFATYSRPDLPLADGVVAEIAGFIARHRRPPP